MSTPMAPAPRLLACGLATLDVVQTVEHVPRPDEKLVAHDLRVVAGGPASNAAVTAVALGVPARLLTRVGGTPLGQVVLADLADHGVQVVDLGTADDAPAVSTVLITRATGDRAVVSINATRSSTGIDEAAIEAALDGATAVLVDGHHLDLALLVAQGARTRGIPVLLDGGSWKPGLEMLLALTDVAVLSDDFRVPAGAPRPTDPPPRPAPRPAGVDSTPARVATYGPTVVASTHGGQPVDLLVGDAWSRLPVPQVRVVDTLGAGDVLHGALAAWLAVRPDVLRAPAGPGHSGPAGMALAVGAGLQLACEVATLSCTGAGARGWLADTAAVDALATALRGP